MRQAGYLAATILMWVATGCGGDPDVVELPMQDVEQSTVEQIRTLDAMEVAGNPGNTTTGMIAQLFIEKHTVRETQRVRAAVLITNIEQQDRPIVDTSDPPFNGGNLVFKVNGAPAIAYPVKRSGKAYPGKIVLEGMGQGQLLVGPVDLLVPPVSGRSQVTATFPMTDEKNSLITGPAYLKVDPATWGEASNGVRMRIEPIQTSLTLGDAFRFRLFIHNRDHENIRIKDRALPRRKVDRTADGKVTLRWEADPGHMGVTYERGMMRSYLSPDLTDLFDKPGTYTFRVSFEAAPSGGAGSTSWYGHMTSNEVTVTVGPRRRRPND